MIHFTMCKKENVATFKDDGNGQLVMVDSFDNREFNVRIGSDTSSVPAGKLVASNDTDLNEKLSDLYSRFKLDNPIAE